MSAIAATDKLFFERADAALDQAAAAHIVGEALSGSDDGELFLEYRESESISLDDGHIRAANFDSGMGFGLRAVAGGSARPSVRRRWQRRFPRERDSSPASR